MEQIEDYCNVIFDPGNLPAGVSLAIADLIKNDPAEYRKASEKLNDMSITYSTSSSGDIPAYILKWIEPYRRPHLAGDKRKRPYYDGRG